MKFALHDFMRGAITRMVMVSLDNGKYTSKRLTFMPDTDYTTEDPMFIKYIKGEVGDCRERMVANDDIKTILKQSNIPYETSMCGHCASAKPKALFNPFRIIEE